MVKKGSKMSPGAIAKIKASKQNMSEETRQKMREAKKGYIPWNKGLTKIDPRVANNSKGGWVHSEESKKIMREKKENYIPWNKGLNKDDPRVQAYSIKLSSITRSPEHCQNISEALIGRDAWNKGIDISDPRVAENIMKTTETRKKLFETGEIKVWNKGETIETDPRILKTSNGYKGLTKETSEKILHATEKQSETMMTKYDAGDLIIWNKGLNKFTHPSMMKIAIARDEFIQTNPGPHISKREDKIAEYFLAQGLIQNKDFIRQHKITKISDPFNSDFYFPKLNLVLESDGTYHHNRPGRPERDKRRNEDMIAKGYRVIRLQDTGRRPKQEFEELKKILNNIIEEIRGGTNEN